MKTMVALLFAGGLLAVIAVPGVSAKSSGTVTLHATLTGSTEVPAKGDPHGSGTATITLTLSKQQVCFSITVHGIKLPAAAAHIHSGHAGKEGPIVVPLTAPGKNGRSVGCKKNVTTSIIKGIENHPSSYYVNVHTTNYSGGAVRGQLQ
jgi:hypothetical protein